jgi:predicted DNA-binding transcriptional regulator YafY
MGQRTATETLFGIVAAFVERSTWSQAELARRLETKPETIRKQLGELQAGGFKLEREEEHPHVFWSVPKNWLPGVLHFKADEAGDLLRLLGRAPRGALRTRVLTVVLSRLRNFGKQSPPADDTGVRSPSVGEEEERWLEVFEDAIQKKSAIKLRYFAASRRNESWRHISPHRVDLGPRPCVVATCHKSQALRRFRLSNVLDAKLDPNEPFRPLAEGELATFDADSLGGFHQDGPRVRCVFFVRDPDASWVSRNLPDERITLETTASGSRFSTDTSGVQILARYVVGLGAAATCETPELATAVATLAQGALSNSKS